MNDDPSGLYAILGIEPSATHEQILKAYRQRVKECHPDIVGDEHRDEFNLVQRAYNVLSDEDARSHYDLKGEVKNGSTKYEDKNLTKVRALLCSKLEEAIDMIGDRIDMANYIKTTINLINKDIMDDLTVKPQIRAHRKRYTKLLKRIRFKGEGFDPVTRMLQIKLDETKQDMKTLKERLDTLEKARAMASLYEDMGPMAFQQMQDSQEDPDDVEILQLSSN